MSNFPPQLTDRQMAMAMCFKSKKTWKELLDKAVDAENKRVTVEWDNHIAKHGNDGSHPAAIALAAMQGDRSVKSFARYM